MTLFRYISIFILLLWSNEFVRAQEDLTQKIHGYVTDAESKTPLIAAIVTIKDHNELSAYTDENGYFDISDVPVGRQTILISLIGYEPKTIPEILITSGKEIELNITLTESITNLKEVVVSAAKDRTKPINEFASVSARSFSVEDTKRYPASVSDPSRMVLNFAGVSSADDGENEIVIRGNSPTGIVWRLEGIEIPNPNHFSILGTSGGAVSMLSASTLSNSDFYTGAFPPEIGNALAGAFDLNFRNGNTDHPEHSFTIGTLGIEASTEGAFVNGSKASYLINYRYSTLAVLQRFFDLGGVLPKYQDLSFKLNFPTKKLGTFAVFGLGGYNTATKYPDEDSTIWNDNNPNYTLDNKAGMGVVGLTHQFFIDNKSYIKTVIAYSYDGQKQSVDTLNPAEDYNRVPVDRTDFNNYTYRGAIVYNSKLSKKNTLRIGYNIQLLGYDLNERYFDNGDSLWKQILSGKGQTAFHQAFFQYKSRLNEQLTFIGGLHFSYLALNDRFSIEPRASLSYRFSNAKSLTLALGLHSKPEHISTYLFDYSSQGIKGTPNKDLKLSKAFHAVLGYDMMLPLNFHFKTEIYFQYLFDIPVEKDSLSGFSMLNAENVFSLVNTKPLVSDGTGKNYGIDLTLEKPFTENYYVLASGSWFNALYTAYYGTQYNSYYNRKYQFNIVGGKEWNVNKKKTSILGANGRIVTSGGLGQSTIDLSASIAERKQVIVPGQYYTSNGPSYFRADVSIYYKANRKKATHTLQLDIQNVSNTKNYFYSYYDVRSATIKYVKQLGLIPNISYSIDFR